MGSARVKLTFSGTMVKELPWGPLRSPVTVWLAQVCCAQRQSLHRRLYQRPAWLTGPGWQGLAVVFINCPLAVTLCQWSGPNLCRQISSVQKWKLIESLAANSSWDTLYKLAYFVKPSLDNTPSPSSATILPLSHFPPSLTRTIA